MPGKGGDCGGVVLAGGQSSRMGRPKAWLEFGGRPLLVHLVERLQAEFPEVIVVAAPDQELPDTPARVVYDEQPGEGPVAGLVVGLRELQSPAAFVCSCDLPFLNPGVVHFLTTQLADHDDVVVPQWDGRLHPLHAIYRTSLQPLLAARLAAGSRRLMEVLDLARTRVVPAGEVGLFDPCGYTFFNMNSPEDYTEALRLWPT